jgi:hypothetical protein
MSWFRKSKNTVTVEFIENGTENPFAISEVPIEQLPDIVIAVIEVDPHAALVELHIDVDHGVAVMFDVGESKLARRPGLFDLHFQSEETFRQRVFVDAAKHECPVFDRHIQFELSRVPALHPANAVHPLAGGRTRSIEGAPHRTFDRIRLVELDSSLQLSLQRKRLSLPSKSDLDEFVHDQSLPSERGGSRARAIVVRNSVTVSHLIYALKGPSMPSDATLAMQKQIVANQKKILAK